MQSTVINFNDRSKENDVLLDKKSARIGTKNLFEILYLLQNLQFCRHMKVDNIRSLIKNNT